MDICKFFEKNAESLIKLFWFDISVRNKLALFFKLDSK